MKKFKVFLDAGHNFAPPDTGAAGFGLREQDVTFEVADTVRALLEFHGIEVRMSRRNLTDILGRTLSESLSLRAEMSNNFGADYCVSIHCNAGGGMGAETYAFKRGGLGDQLAHKIQAQLVNVGMRNRGVKYSQDFFMLRRPIAPAVLVELGFIDNANDNDILRNRQFELAKAVAIGIMEQLGIDYNSKEEEFDVNESENRKEHWAKPFLERLVSRGVVETPEAWIDFDASVSRGAILALTEKLINYIRSDGK